MELPTLTALLTYRLIVPADNFTAVADRLVERVRQDGDPGVLAYRIFTDPAAALARSVVDYRDPDAWIGHHRLITDWPEMWALRTSAELTRVIFLGDVTSDMLRWMAQSGLVADVRHGSRFTAGFIRP